MVKKRIKTARRAKEKALEIQPQAIGIQIFNQSSKRFVLSCSTGTSYALLVTAYIQQAIHPTRYESYKINVQREGAVVGSSNSTKIVTKAKVAYPDVANHGYSSLGDAHGEHLLRTQIKTSSST
jgi:hypothetical protein